MAMRPYKRCCHQGSDPWRAPTRGEGWEVDLARCESGESSGCTGPCPRSVLSTGDHPGNSVYLPRPVPIPRIPLDCRVEHMFCSVKGEKIRNGTIPIQGSGVHARTIRT